MNFTARVLINRFLLSICLATALCASSSAQSLTQIGEWKAPYGETAYYVTVRSNIAYVTTRNALKIIDVSDPKNPTLIGQALLYSPNDQFGRLGKPTIVGNRLFVVHASLGAYEFLNVDIRTLQTPFAMSGVSYTGDAFNDSAIAAFGIGVENNRLYVPLGALGVQIFDITDPDSPPTSLGRATPGDFAMDVKVANGLAYIADGNGGLKIMDVTVPQAPWLVGSAPTGASRQVVLRGNYAYVGSYVPGGGVLQAVNISNPVNPAIEYTSPFTDTGAGFYDCSGLALTATSAILGFQIAWGVFDLSSAPQITRATVVKDFGIKDVDVSGDMAYMAEGNGGLVTFKIQNLSTFTRLGNYPLGSLPTTVTISGNYAYFGDNFNGTHIVDISDPVHPAKVSLYAPENGLGHNQNVGAVAFNGTTAYFAVYGGFDIVDLSVPANPVRLGIYRSGIGFPTLVASGNYVYTSLGATGPGEVIDVSNPSAPQKVATISAVGTLGQMALRGNFIYYSLHPNLGNEIGVIDISNPMAPVKRGSLSNVTVSKMKLDFPYLYVLANGTISTYYVGTPDQVTFASSRGPAAITGMAVSNPYFYQLAGKTLTLYNVTDPLSPVAGPSFVVTNMNTGFAADLDAKGNILALVSGGDGALRLFQAQLPVPPDRPSLQALYQNGDLILRWPKTFADYQLYFMTAVGQPTQLVTSNPFTDGDNLTFTNTRPVGGAVFYILKK